MDRIEITSDILFKYFSGHASGKELDCILFWLEESKDNKNEFIKIKKLFTETSQHYSDSEKNGQMAFEDFEGRIEKVSGGNHKPITKSLYPFLKYAASILIMFGIAFSAYLVGKSDNTNTGKNDYYVVDVPYGGKSSISLPDGSTVHLNAGTTLKYSKDFGSNSRELFIEGEGLFEVEKHKYPMVVHTSHIDIKVLGTVFNVKSYRNEDNIETTLLEGAIQVKTNNIKTDEPMFLKPNDKLVFNKSNLSVSSASVQTKGQQEGAGIQKDKNQLQKQYRITSDVDVATSIAWKEGKYIFTGETLEELAIILTRKFDVKFLFENDAVKNHTYSGTLGDYPIEQVLEALSLTSPVVYEIKEKQIYLALDMDKLNTYKNLIND